MTGHTHLLNAEEVVSVCMYRYVQIYSVSDDHAHLLIEHSCRCMVIY